MSVNMQKIGGLAFIQAERLLTKSSLSAARHEDAGGIHSRR